MFNHKTYRIMFYKRADEKLRDCLSYRHLKSTAAVVPSVLWYVTVLAI